ncbi:MAG: chorismate mutase [Pseudomonadales bacterium]
METLEDMRKSIDNIDNAIVAMFAERFKLTNRVGYYKAKKGLPAKDLNRESEQYERVVSLANQYSLDPEFAKSYLAAVIKHVIKNHKNIANQFKDAAKKVL